MNNSPLIYSRLFIACAGVLGLFAILFGAYSSHALEGNTANWATIAVRYQIWHSIPLLALGIWCNLASSDTPLPKLVYLGGILWIVGIVLFSGSLSLMALTNWREIGILTPFGGLTLACGWLCILLSAFRLKPAAV